MKICTLVKSNYTSFILIQDSEILPSQDSVVFPTPRNPDTASDDEITDPTPTMESSKKVTQPLY